MARIAGVNLPNQKRLEIGLTYIYGIGQSTAKKICAVREDLSPSFSSGGPTEKPGASPGTTRAERPFFPASGFVRDVHRYRIQVGRDAFGFRPERERGKSQQAGSGADIGDVAEPCAPLLEPVERCEAARRCRMLAGSEG